MYIACARSPDGPKLNFLKAEWARKTELRIGVNQGLDWDQERSLLFPEGLERSGMGAAAGRDSFGFNSSRLALGEAESFHQVPLAHSS